MQVLLSGSWQACCQLMSVLTGEVHHTGSKQWQASLMKLSALRISARGLRSFVEASTGVQR